MFLNKFVIEDPQNPLTFRERRHRSKAELETQKKCIRELKEFGGACLWCYRSKKKCGPIRSCPSCVQNKRECIRHPEQLYFPEPVSFSQSSDQADGPCQSFNEAVDTLQRIRRQAFQRADVLHATIDIRVADEVHTCALEIASGDKDLSDSNKYSIDQFISHASNSVGCISLVRLGSQYPGHALIHDAIRIATMFFTASSLAKSRLYLHTAEADAGRLVMFSILTVCFQNIASLAREFSDQLCEALRRKDTHDCYYNGKYQPQTANSLSPVWVANALYYRVVCALLDLQTTSPIKHLFSSLNENLQAVRATLWSILKAVSPRKRARSKESAKKVMKEEIPPLPPSICFNLVFHLTPTRQSVDVPMSHGDDLLSNQFLYIMESVHANETSSLLNFEPHMAQPVNLESAVADMAQPGEAGSSIDSSRIVPLPSNPAAIGFDLLDEAFDPMRPESWSWGYTTSIDDTYVEQTHGLIGAL
ncbi:hypothetical protein N7462_007552 [Penicillium macrosclerotiorum]|uniref:uncharacterized protein n=1 Tax=Penicillium macrosclerotiorum TaxID=303699 RepID=UPI002548CE08|nr:uncharacterized protein N7462_007552 [Penicillium macrosclerotiorum]KAJ5679308.1 hypothetical protein N7462_007552 [Penicillium macrosclerotiorum]